MNETKATDKINKAEIKKQLQTEGPLDIIGLPVSRKKLISTNKVGRMNRPKKIEAGVYRYRGYIVTKIRTASDYKTGMSSTYWGLRFGRDIFAMTLKAACEDVDRLIERKA